MTTKTQKMRDIEKIVQDELDEQWEFDPGWMALTALKARHYIASKGNKYIEDLAKCLGIKNPLLVAWLILDYLYPRNEAYWHAHDEYYKELVEKSALVHHISNTIDKK